VDKLEQQIEQIKASIECLEELPPTQKRSLIEAIDELYWTAQSLRMTPKTGASQEELEETHQALEAECQRYRELEQLHQLQDKFLSIAFHELRTPITNMTMAVHLLSRMLEQDGSLLSQTSNSEARRSKITRYFQIILNECDRQTNLIDNLLDLQRLETNRQPFSPTAIHLLEWLPSRLELFEQQAHNHQQHFETLISPNLPPLLTDADSLERIVTELLTNACKYTPFQETITITVQTTDKGIELKVSNTGIEIPPHEQTLIFDKFYRNSKCDRTQQGGSGLGLALVEKLVAHLGGTIQVESASSLTCFTVALPLKSKVGKNQ